MTHAHAEVEKNTNSAAERTHRIGISCAIDKDCRGFFLSGTEENMNVLMGILSVVCLAYFALLIAVGMDFSWIWLIAGLFLGGAMLARKYMAAHSLMIGKGLKGILILVIGVAFLVFFFAECRIISGMGEKPQGKLDYMIVLGAQVHGDQPSRALTLRLEEATKVWKECGEPTILLSGGKGDGENISEAECMHRVLLEKGIPEEKMVLEDRSTSTVENLKFCAEVSNCREKKTGIVSNNFHVYRAKELAKRQGYQDVCGIAAKSDWRFQIHYMVREAFALVKEKLTGNIA